MPATAVQTNGKAAPAIKDAAQLLREAGEQFGQNLPEGVPMVIHSWTTNEIQFVATVNRPARTGVQINLDLSPVDDLEDIQDYHCFSAVLLRQLRAIGADNLPAKATFARRPTKDGRVDETGQRFAAWTIVVD